MYQSRASDLGKERRRVMKWGKEVMVARTSPEVYRRVRASPSESEVREDFGVTGRGSDAKGVGGKEVERKGDKRERRGCK